MTCSGITACTAVELPARTAVTNALEAVVFREILKPLAAGLGPVGEVAIGSVADAVFATRKA